MCGLSNMSADTRLAGFVALAKLRRRIEYDDRELKQVSRPQSL